MKTFDLTKIVCFEIKNLPIHDLRVSDEVRGADPAPVSVIIYILS